MDFKDLIKLIDAGFTKDDIQSMIAAWGNADNHTVSLAPEQEGGSPVPSGASDAAQAPAAAGNAAPPATAPAEPQGADIAKMISDAIDAKFNDIRLPLMPSIGDIKSVGIDDIISKFFKEE